MKYLSFILLAMLFSCSSAENNKNISFEVSKAVHVKMTFERLAEFENNSEKKKALQAFYQTLEIDSNPGFIGWKINKTKQQVLKDFIELNKVALLIDGHHSFVWKTQQNEALLFQQNNKETLDLSAAIEDYTINENSIEIDLNSKGTQALRMYTLKSINKTLLLHINKQLISISISLGDFKDGTLTIENIDPEILKSL
jgi:hypothetical protein